MTHVAQKKQEKAFLVACKGGDIDALSGLLERGAQVNAVEKNKKTDLSSCQNTTILGADPCGLHHEKNSAFHESAKNRHVSVVAELIGLVDDACRASVHSLCKVQRLYAIADVFALRDERQARLAIDEIQAIASCGGNGRAMMASKAFIALCLLGFLSACDSPSGPSGFIGSFSLSSLKSAPAETPSVDVFHARVVPPDPGSAATATVAGVDTNQNGIRDEVDRYIAQKYGGDATQFAAAQMLAQADQRLLITPTTNLNAATAAVFANADAGVCLARAFPIHPKIADRMSDDMVLQSFNTRDRQKQAQAIASKVGQFTRSTDGVVCP